MLFTQKFHKKLPFFIYFCFFFYLGYKLYMLFAAHTRDLWYLVIMQSLEIEVDIKCVKKMVILLVYS